LATDIAAAELGGRGVRRNAEGEPGAQAAAERVCIQTFAKVEPLEHLNCLSQIFKFSSSPCLFIPKVKFEN